MSVDIKITYVNHSMNLDRPSVFIFTKNEVPTFDALKHGIAWRVLPDLGRGSFSTFLFPVLTQISASWAGGSCITNKLDAAPGTKFAVTKDNTGIVLQSDGSAANTRSIDVVNDVQTPNGVSVNLYKDGRIMMTKKIVGYDQKATFVMHPKLYWGLASEIQEGQQISSAVLNSEQFFEMDLEGMSEATVGLYGNACDGYQFKVDSWK